MDHDFVDSPKEANPSTNVTRPASAFMQAPRAPAGSGDPPAPAGDSDHLVSCFWCERIHLGEHPLAVCSVCAASYATLRSLEMSGSYPLSDSVVDEVLTRVSPGNFALGYMTVIRSVSSSWGARTPTSGSAFTTGWGCRAKERGLPPTRRLRGQYTIEDRSPWARRVPAALGM